MPTELTLGDSLDNRVGRGHTPSRGPRPEHPLPLILSIAAVVAFVEDMVSCDCASSVDGDLSKIWKRSLHTDMIEFGTLSFQM
jgi:hypothetical protein